MTIFYQRPLVPKQDIRPPPQKPGKFPFTMRFFLHKPEEPKVGDTVFSYAKGNVELFTDSGWLELCKLSDEMKTELEKTSPEEEKKENIRRLFGRDLDI